MAIATVRASMSTSCATSLKSSRGATRDILPLAHRAAVVHNADRVWVGAEGEYARAFMVGKANADKGQVVTVGGV
jgi:hypothetical protein